MDNQVSFELSKDEHTQVTQAIETLVTILGPKLITLLPNDRKELPKMGNKTVSSVEKSLEYGEQYPNYIPAFIDISEAQKDFTTVKSLRQICLPLERILTDANDTMTLAGSEAYSSALSIYKVLKMQLPWDNLVPRMQVKN